MKKNKIKTYFSIIKENLANSENEKSFFQYYENTWLKKNYDLFNYYELIADIICKNLYINKNGDNNSDKTLKSKIKSLNQFYLTNNVCESLHSKISLHLPKGKISKNSFRETIDAVLKDNSF